MGRVQVLRSEAPPSSGCRRGIGSLSTWWSSWDVVVVQVRNRRLLSPPSCRNGALRVGAPSPPPPGQHRRQFITNAWDQRWSSWDHNFYLCDAKQNFIYCYWETISVRDYKKADEGGVQVISPLNCICLRKFQPSSSGNLLLYATIDLPPSIKTCSFTKKKIHSIRRGVCVPLRGGSASNHDKVQLDSGGNSMS